MNNLQFENQLPGLTCNNEEVFSANTFAKEIKHSETENIKLVSKDMPVLPVHVLPIDDDENGKIIDNRKNISEDNTNACNDTNPTFFEEKIKNVHDIRRRFNASSTAFQVLQGIDLSGKYALITGSNSGIGYETARSLAKHGCNILFANRNMESTKQAIDKITKEMNVAEGRLKAVYLNLSSLKCVKECALSVKTLFSDHLDMVILNAGLFGQPHTESEDGFELTFQANHLGHLYLALLLEPLLKKNSRVVFVSSESHRLSNLTKKITRERLSVTRQQYSTTMTYYNSKFCNLITAKVLSEEWKHNRISVNSLHPGSKVSTNISRARWVYKLVFWAARPFTKTPQQAAATSVYVATHSDLEGITGVYFKDCFYCQESASARDEDIAKQVFSISLKMIQESVGHDHIEKYLDKY